ncbi:CLAVATA3/ESR (CLE)-related protein 46 [Macadamia integrifolia]|uniref:CLAVATA3/ESR (CLE)-related protein 46 n=1 Tax=Macadamia integrifolia TaxID=60698 RepID=UPI001C52AB92|nr:CLAVATA3/ESR (CLE)-related protein 46 [Macadamia integrifolia]
MKGRQILTHLLLGFILLAVAASYSHFSNSIMVQAVESAAFRLGRPQLGSPSASGSTLSAWTTRNTIEERKASKVPSGPSPIGNRHPPTKP